MLFSSCVGVVVSVCLQWALFRADGVLFIAAGEEHRRRIIFASFQFESVAHKAFAYAQHFLKPPCWLFCVLVFSLKLGLAVVAHTSIVLPSATVLGAVRLCFSFEAHASTR